MRRRGSTKRSGCRFPHIGGDFGHTEAHLWGGAVLAELRASLAVDAAEELNRGVEARVAGLRAQICSAINDPAGADLQRAL